MFTVASDSEAYAEAREELRQAEIELTEQRERVAALRRALPASPLEASYTFETVPDGDRVELADLVSEERPFVLYHLMLGKAQTEACPMCTMWIDGWNAITEHLDQKVDFAIVAAADPGTIAKYIESRTLDNLVFFSAADSSFKLDFGSETPDGHQIPTISVFTKQDGQVIHDYTGSALQGDDHYRGLDLLSPVWNVLDLTPEGRGDWMPSVSYS